MAAGNASEKRSTVEPRFTESLFNEVLDITNDILCSGQSSSKMCGLESRYNEPRYNELHCQYVNTRQKINAVQINSQQIL